MGDVGRRVVALAVLALLLFATLLGAASSSSSSATLNPGMASQIMTTAVTLVGLLLVGLVVMLLVSVMGKPSDSRTQWKGKQRTWVVLLIPILLGVIAELLGLLVHPHKPTTHHQVLPATSGGPPPDTSPRPSKVKFESGTAGDTIAVVLFVVVVVMVGGWFAQRRLRRSGRFSLLEAEPLQSVLGDRSDLASTLASIEIPDPSKEADPRRAVVAAYLAMTHGAAAAGSSRRNDETPAEFLQRLLLSLGVSHGGAERLTRLFERARYSSMPVDESLRRDAIGALAEVEAELRSYAAASAGEPGGSATDSGTDSGLAGAATGPGHTA